MNANVKYIRRNYWESIVENSIELDEISVSQEFRETAKVFDPINSSPQEEEYLTLLELELELINRRKVLIKDILDTSK